MISSIFNDQLKYQHETQSIITQLEYMIYTDTQTLLADIRYAKDVLKKLCKNVEESPQVRRSSAAPRLCLLNSPPSFSSFAPKTHRPHTSQTLSPNSSNMPREQARENDGSKMP